MITRNMHVKHFHTSQVWTFDRYLAMSHVQFFFFAFATSLWHAFSWRTWHFRNSHDSDHLIMFKGCMLHWCDWQPVSENLFIPGFDSILRLVHVKIQKIYINLSILFMVQKSGSPVEFGSFSHYLRGFLHPSWVTFSPDFPTPSTHQTSTDWAPRTRQGVANDRMRHCTYGFRPSVSKEKMFWKFNSAPLKMCHAKGKFLSTFIFQGRAVKLRGCNDLLKIFKDESNF